ncbi:hypothetical protein RF679_15665 [Undibacterium cyanobacteriorum]|uniref:Uncharacterized protein n=1 Tax=Undibacterium cyanobacteriorum TaxID=3073561 RepID=A0ABY9RGJ0_9BURK|nr:hypothetical protein [Undibacterium sp. 20NA77.5]WMW80071.1 hypothetical protein RF679_15665 [Undibacterium sp. 20NA77.5]
MKFLPYEKIKIKSHLSSAEVLQRLDKVIEPRRYFRFLEKSSKPYEGKIEGARFDASRILQYRNPFRPKIVGDVQVESQGCTINLTMRPDAWVIAFMVLFLGSIAISFLAALVPVMTSLGEIGTEKRLSLLSSLAMLTLLHIFFLALFKFESAKSKDFFQDLLNAENVEEIGFSQQGI